MGDGWMSGCLGDFVTLRSGGTPAKSEPKFWSGTTPWVSAKDMKQLRLHDTELHIDALEAGWTSRLAPPGTVLLLTRGMTLLQDIPMCVVQQAMAFNQDVKAVRAKGGLLKAYLPYLLLGRKHDLLGLVDLAGHGTGRLVTDQVTGLPVDIPPIGEQQAIAYVLGALDDKIELSRRMNETLEQMAQAIFKSWFIDFDGHDDLVDSPIGLVPRGWEAGTLGDVTEITMGQSPPGSTYNENGQGIPFFQGATDFGAVFPTNRVYCTAPTRFAEQWDVLISVRAPVGRANLARERCAIGRGVASIRSQSGHRSYAWCLIKGLSAVLDVYNGEGTVFGSINKKALHAVRVVVPPIAEVAAFEKVARPLLSRLQVTADESRTLVVLRDTLLPRLISGEIRIPDAERVVGGVV